jgi:hypothetical protein
MSGGEVSTRCVSCVRRAPSAARRSPWASARSFSARKKRTISRNSWTALPSPLPLLAPEVDACKTNRRLELHETGDKKTKACSGSIHRQSTIVEDAERGYKTEGN